MPRRRIILCSLALLAATLVAPAAALAQAYPQRPVTIVVPYPAGGTVDIIARIVGDALSARLGQPVVIENRPGGASGNVGMDAVAKAAPDGHTIGLALASILVNNPFIYKTMPFDPLKDLAPVAPIAEGPQMLAVHDSVPARTLQELIALAKASPGKLNYASAGPGSTAHLGAHLFARAAGIDIVHVPYRGIAPAANDLLAGNVQMMSSSVGSIWAGIQAKKLRVLAVATKQRLRYLPDVPTSAEAGVPAYEITTWFGLVAPAATPKEIVARLNGHVRDLQQDPATRKRLDDILLDVMSMTPEEFADYIKADYERYRTIIREAGITPQ
jgi:tripartite-type tricarboxylate transporter receptor subunit TctC